MKRSLFGRYNVGVRFGPKAVYVIYHTPLDAATAVAQLDPAAAVPVDPLPITRTLLCEVPTPRPCYMHSFAMSSSYIVLSESPVHIDLLRMFTAPLTGTALTLSTSPQLFVFFLNPQTTRPISRVLQAQLLPNHSFSTPTAAAASSWYFPHTSPIASTLP
jgi:hypothetical protein